MQGAILERVHMEEVVGALRALYSRGLVQSLGGNVSKREGSVVYITPTRRFRGSLRWSDAAAITMEGRVLRGRPSSEWRMHVAIYKALGWPSAVVHAHPPHVLAAARRGLVFETGMLMEAEHTLGCVSVVPRMEPGTWGLAESVARAFSETGCKAVVMADHGAVTVGRTVWHALDMMESLEDLARIQLLTGIGGHGGRG